MTVNNKKSYLVTITETRKRIVSVLANNASDAAKKASHIYNSHKEFLNRHQFVEKVNYTPYLKQDNNS